MKTFRVVMRICGTTVYEVEATDADAAEDAAYDLYEDGDEGLMEWEADGVCDVEELS